MAGENENIFSFQTDVVHKAQQAAYPQVVMKMLKIEREMLSTDGCERVFTSCVKNNCHRPGQGGEIGGEKFR